MTGPGLDPNQYGSVPGLGMLQGRRELETVSRNDPIIVIDGVRIDASARGGQRGGFGASRLNDISPEDIESIEVIKGPAAATLYGTEASNGVNIHLWGFTTIESACSHPWNSPRISGARAAAPP